MARDLSAGPSLGQAQRVLTLLRIDNLALFQRVEIAFGPGLTALTGESGAGKSILLDALSLIAGSPRTRLRPGPNAKTGLVEAEFDITAPSLEGLRHHLSQAGLPVEDNLILARRIDARGRTRCFGQGQTISRELLAELASDLFEQCGQGEAHGLRQPRSQLDLIDAFGKLGKQVKRYQEVYRRWTDLDREQRTLNDGRDDDLGRLDFVDYQLTELTDAPVEAFSDDAAALDQLRDERELAALCHEIDDELRAGGQSVVSRIDWLSRRLEQVDSPHIAELIDQLARLSELTHQAADHASQTAPECSPEEISATEERVTLVRDLARKHRVAPEELAGRVRELELERASLNERLERLDELTREAAAARSELASLGQTLHEARARVAPRLTKKVLSELAQVDVPRAVFEVQLAAVEPGPTGATRLEMTFSANPGTAPAPLNQVASGGELARVLLATRLAADSPAPLLVFDEIDTGTGGDTAAHIGSALARAGQRGQVLCVTHLPQVAGQADQHLLSKKHTTKETTQTEVSLLDEGSRITELTRMLGGASATARQHAKGLRRSG